MDISTKNSASICHDINLSEFDKIQPHGGLLVVDKQTSNIIQCSENIESILHITLSSLLGKQIQDFIVPDSLNFDFNQWVQEQNKKYTKVLWENKNEPLSIWVFTHCREDLIILEVEPTQEFKSNDLEYRKLQQLITLNLSAKDKDVSQLSALVCNEVYKLTGYDRISIYHFEEDGSGIVLGEAITKNMDSFLGLKFPATDVPDNVKKMYVHQPFRYIPTITYQPVSLMPSINPITLQSLGLSFFTLRTVAPIHLEYLKNMGARSAFSIAIMCKDKLWGLISCQHKQAKVLSVEERILLSLISTFFSHNIELLASRMLHEQGLALVRMQNELSKAIFKLKSVDSAFKKHYKNILKMISATGMVFYHKNRMIQIGITPTKDQINQLINWIWDKHNGETYVTESLPREFPSSIIYKDIACGILAVPIMPKSKNLMIFFRPEIIHTVNWAGDPNNVLTLKCKTYTPRASFATWKQQVEGTSNKWTVSQIRCVEYMRSLTTIKELQLSLHEQATHDELTGLLNRRMMNNTLEAELSRCMRKQTPLSIMIIDIDHFKQYNDKYGHQAGDEVLKSFSNFIKRKTRLYDHIFRYGGEEFSIILDDLSLDQAIQRAEKLRQEVSGLTLSFDNKILPVLTISIGIANFPLHAENIKELLYEADQALYKAKNTGRNKVIVAPKKTGC